MTIETLLKNHETKENEIAEEMAKLKARQKRTKSSLVTKLKVAFNKDPDQALDVPALINYLDSKQVLKLIAHVASLRALRSEELTDDLYFKIECHSYQSKNPALATAIFNGLESDQERLRFALFSAGIASIYSTVPAAMAFLNEHFAIEEGIVDKPNYLRYDGYNPQLHQAVLKLSTTRRCHEGLDALAQSFMDLVKMGYQCRYIDVFESTLSTHGVFGIHIIEREASAGEYDFTLVCCRYGRDSDIYTGRGDTSEVRLTDLFKYIADNHPYQNVDEDYED